MHFTYEGEDGVERKALRQGDILRRTPRVDELLRLVHPHYYQHAEYKFFQVLTQSCDLERRDGRPCRARYVTVAAVRPVRVALDRETDNFRHTAVESQAHIADASKRQNLVQFVQRLLNNNEPAYFYLHEELEAGLSEPYCAFLRLSIAIRAQEHYETCLEAKILQLRPEFQAKLGWLVGNLYSRVGTTDWAENGLEREYKDRVERLVDETSIWVERRIHARLVKALEEERGPVTIEMVRQKLGQLKGPSRRERASERLRGLLPALGVNESHVDGAVARLLSDPEFAQLLRD